MLKYLNLDLSKPLEKIKIDGGARNRQMPPKPKPVETGQQVEGRDGVFTKEFIKKKSDELFAELSKNVELPFNASVLTSYDHIDDAGLEDKKSLDVHQQYLTEPNHETELPIYAFKQKILRAIHSGQVTIINGGTGCGKTTQAPQYVLDECYDNRQECNIIVTQPRRIAAVSIANRVCEERNWPKGTICGYQIGQDQILSDDTRLLYCTTGVLLQKIIYRRTLSDYTHIFLDEVHERSQDMDFLLLLIRLHLRDSKTKVILMSATMDNKMFINYFNSVNPGITNVIEIDAPARFHTSTFYIDNFPKFVNVALGIFEECQTPQVLDIAKKCCISLLKKTQMETNSAVLIFLPGIMEIREFQLELKQLRESADWIIFTLHSSIPSDEQAQVMRKYQAKYRKIILATNIAESSITLPDVEIVFDFCLSKSLQFDRHTESVSLQTHWISKHEGTQRAGRVGRVAPGRVYRLVPGAFYDSFPCMGEPEMLKAPIERTVLRAKALRLSDPVSVLSQAIEPPMKFEIRHAVKLLKEAGALTYKINGVHSDDDGDMTFLGNIMARLPLDYQLAKLVALGYACGVLEDAAIIAAYLSLHRLFLFPVTHSMDAYSSLRTWAENSQCDAIAALTAFEEYREKYTSADLTRGEGSSEASWAKQCYLQLRTLKEMDLVVNDILQRVKPFMADLPTAFLAPYQLDLRRMILKFVIAGAFYGNYFSASNCTSEKDVLKEINELNPFQTVTFAGYPSEKIGVAYTPIIQNYFNDCRSPAKPYVSFYRERVFVEFPAVEKKDTRDFGVRHEPIRLEMYLAMYKNLIKKNLTIPLFNYKDNEEIAEKLGLGDEQRSMGGKRDPTEGDHRREVSNLPPINKPRIFLRIVHLINPGHFMAASDYDAKYQELEKELLKFNHKPLIGLPGIGCLYLFKRNDVYVRVRVEEFYEKHNEVQLLLVDIGKRRRIAPNALLIPNEGIAEKFYSLPALIFECRLAKIEPSVNNDCARKWTARARQVFTEATEDALLNAVVYSVVDGVVRLRLFAIKGQEEICVNDLLIEEKVAVLAYENFLSEANHNEREKDQGETSKEYFAHKQRLALRLPPRNYPDLERYTSLKQCTLKGPKSSLLCKLHPVGVVRDSTKVTVSSESVNAVIFNTWPEDEREMLLIAHGRSYRTKKNTINIKQCTLMPDIRGLQCLMSLLFAPRVQLRSDPLQTRYTSALCGMGAREDGVAVYPQNDFNVVFDTHFTNEDLRLVNQMRASISTLLYTSDESVIYPNYSRIEFEEAIRKIQNSFSGLLVDREKREKIFPVENTTTWDSAITVDDDRILYPTHKVLNLRNPEALINILRDQIYPMSKKEIPFEPCECPVCNIFFDSQVDLYNHTMTMRHQNNENILFN